ncbi:Polyadenylate-binding protein 1-like [Symbiodinium microadriaticum]|uniref:Polyadenylate-binding protein 1-like n=1 Tax=Symbiodinium microadriaticum TaxID=2951 RepID=A0A1Q9CTN6_SYMMI|nr:Polyadenylate-binding protein 1-like [Symbiodinium microadriaticum]
MEVTVWKQKRIGAWSDPFEPAPAQLCGRFRKVTWMQIWLSGQVLTMTVMDATKEEGDFTNLYVKCFPPHFKEQDLCELFSGFGPIQAAKVMTDNRGRSFGFVNFEQSKDAKECVRLMHCKDLRTRKELKEAKKLEAEGKAPPIRRDVDGHPEHLLYVSRAQKREEREAMFQKQFADKGLGRGNGGISKGKGKGDGKGDLFNEGGGLNQSLGSDPFEDLTSGDAAEGISIPFPASPPAWQQPSQYAYGSGNCQESHSQSFRYTNGHNHDGFSGSAGGGWSAPEAASTNWQGPNWPAGSSWEQGSWSGWRADNLAMSDSGSGSYCGAAYSGCDGYESPYSGSGLSYPGPSSFGQASASLRRGWHV